MIGIQPGRNRPSAPPPGGTLLAQFGASRSIAGTLVLMMFIGLLSLSNTMPAFAAPVNEITARWAENTPAEVAPGDVVTAEWRVNVNDDAAAPSNAPVDNVTFTATATHGKFTAIPDICLTTGVTPPSSISEDGTTLVCNLGTQKMGTAVAIQTPVMSDGSTGDELTLSGSMAGATATVPAIPIVGHFGMDIKWDDSGSWSKWVNNNTAVQMSYPWTLNLLKGSDPGPNTASYTITLAPSVGGPTSAVGCQPYNTVEQSGHPWSGGTHPADQTAPFVGSCTLTPTGTPNQYTMTLTGIDYSQTQVPTKDAAGNNLPTDRVAIASGEILFQLPTTQAGSMRLTSSAPTYVSATNQTSTDDAANNTANKTFFTPGSWVSAYAQGGTGQGGTPLDGSYLASSGQTLQLNHLSQMQGNSAFNGQTIYQCSVMDTQYVTYADSGEVNTVWYADTATGENWGDENGFDPRITRWYYVGNDPSVIPGSGSYNPEAMAANCDVDPAGWTTTKPADLSTIKAVRTAFNADDFQAHRDFVSLYYQTIKPGVPAGQDIWQFSSYKIGSGAWEYHPEPNYSVTPTPGTRYPYTTGFRDIVRIVAVTPDVEKSVDRTSVRVGDPATFTISYSANGGAAAPPTVDDFTITDTLPIGMEYELASATPEPVISQDGSGRQVLTWSFDGVTTNVVHTLSYQAKANDQAVPGKTLTNSVIGNVAGLDSAAATASVTVSENGLTTIGKTADEAFIPNVNGDGVGAGSWTVTLKSEDPKPQAFTDTIDILPYNGDGRGTSYSGSYALTEVTAVDGSTVYYTAADPASLNDDPAHASNGAAGNVTGNTAGWSTTKPANPTAVRVVGPALAPGATQAFKVSIQTTGVEGGDVLVNRAQARAEHTELVMRTSAPISVANYYSASLKKYVRDAAGVWHDANTVEDYPTFRTGDTVPYRIVVTNTGQGTLTNVVVSDDKYPAEGGFTIASLAPGAEQTHEFTVTLGDDVASTFVNTASAVADRPKDSNVPPTINTDRAGIEVANYTTVKTSDPAPGSTVVPGQKITYTVTVAQSGSAPAAAVFTDNLAKVLDDADYNGDAVASIGNVSVEGSSLSWNGTVPVGGKATVTYSVTVKDPAAGDKDLTNVVTSPGCVPVEGQFPDCTTKHVKGAYTVSKTSDPASGSTVVPGQKITYTVHVKQSGPGALTGVTVTDDLSKVLDDAAFNNDATASAGKATFDSKAKTLVWTGDLPVDADVTITYSVTAAPLGTGDGKIANVVTPTSPGGTCDKAIGCNTTHVEGAYTVSKTADPVSGPKVKAGDKITYTVHVKQTGPGALTGVTVTDDLSKVLDDAAFNNDATASAGKATFDSKAKTLVWTGDLPVGADITITYSVTVSPQGTGDGKIVNVVTPTSPGGTCDKAIGCTTNHDRPFDPVTPVTPAGLANTGGLAYTGANVTGFALLALFALLAGGALLAYRRRAKG